MLIAVLKKLIDCVIYYNCRHTCVFCNICLVAEFDKSQTAYKINRFCRQSQQQQQHNNNK